MLPKVASAKFGVRRQSEAATALWIQLLVVFQAQYPKRCRATLAAALQNSNVPNTANRYPWFARHHRKMPALQ